MSEDRLSEVFAALADPTRRDMVARLADGDATLTELAESYDVSVQAVSKHLKVLEQAGLSDALGADRSYPPYQMHRLQLRHQPAVHVDGEHAVLLAEAAWVSAIAPGPSCPP